MNGGGNGGNRGVVGWHAGLETAALAAGFPTLTRRGVLAGVAGALAAGVLPALVGCAPAAPPRRLRMACGETGGNYLQFGELLSAAMDRRASAGLVLSGQRSLNLEAVVTNGSAENLELLQSGEVDLAIALADAVEEHRGNARDQGAEGNVAIGRVYQNYLHCAVLADSPIRDLAGLRGSRVSVGAAGSGSSFTSRRLLGAVGLDEASGGPRLNERGLNAALSDLQRGSIDAVFWAGGVPTPMIAEFSARVPLRLLDLSRGAVALEHEDPLVYLESTIPAEVYGAATPTATLGIPNLLLADPGLSAEMTGLIVDALVFDARRLVPDGSVGAQFLTPVSLIDTGTVPLHAAARDRYRELYG